MFIIPLLRQDLTQKEFLSPFLSITDSNIGNQSFLTQNLHRLHPGKLWLLKLMIWNTMQFTH